MSGTGITMHPSVKNLESVVKRVRDVLRKGDGITDMDSMAHCVLFTAARMLDTATATKLNVPYTWVSVISKVLAKDINGADKAFKDILEVLDSRFSTNEFTWKLKVQDDFEKIVKLFNELDIHEVAKHTDVLGFIYEQHISTGSGGGRDLGKFYTDRQITRYLTELLGSDITAGRPDSMCDATMGTGGFILSYIEYVTKMCPEVKWDDYDLAGGDIDDKVAAIARLNVFLRTGKLFPMIRKRNTLKNDIGDSSDKRKTFKRLLMNIPFGVKGLTLADDCCERIKEIVKVGTKSEPLFMTLTCQLLAEGGKAAVIVPDGVLENCSKQHEIFRKYLLDNFKVLRIIKMHGKFFMNTGIQPSVIVFERNGKTDIVEFWDVEKVASGELLETCMLKVSRERFDGSCSFVMRRYQEAKSVANLAGFPMVKLGDLVEIEGGDYITKNSEVIGEYPVYGGGTASYHINRFNREPTCVINKDGMSPSCVQMVNTRFFLNHHGWTLKMKADNILEKFLHWQLYFRATDIYALATGSCQKGLNQKEFTQMMVYIPPLSIQKEIVESLDLIYNNSNTARVAAASIKAQMVAVMRSVGARGYEKKKLGDLCEFNTNIQKHDTSFGKETGAYPFYTGAMNNKLFTDAPDIKHPVIIMNRTNGAGKCNLYIDSNCAVAGQTIVFYMKDKNTTTLQYLYYYLNTYKTRVEEGYIGSNHKNMSNGFMEMFLVELPPLAIQQEVLTILNEMESELKMMEQMEVKAQERAKYILDGYLTSQTRVEPEVVQETPVEPVIPINEVVEAPINPADTPKPKKTILKLKKNTL